jgi:hypothetical protein
VGLFPLQISETGRALAGRGPFCEREKIGIILPNLGNLSLFSNDVIGTGNRKNG